MKQRYLTKEIADDLTRKMVFISGARQVGKTSMGMEIARRYFSHADYLNWDARDDRKRFLEGRFAGDANLIMLDEIHKYADWKNHVKGLFDKHKEDCSFLVTGGARLDIYRRGGDSLMGRYYAYRLHPFSLTELLGCPTPTITPLEALQIPDASTEATDALQNLMIFGGFPEPLLGQSQRELRRWHNQRVDRLVREDIRDIETIRSLSRLQLLVDSLPERIGSLLSINALREDLSVAHKTAAHWLDVLEHFYYHFRIYPFAGSRIRSLKKNPKLYLWDWSEVGDGGARLENLVASHLLKLCHYLQDVDGRKTELHFLRDNDGREVDFLVTEAGRPWFAVEVKSSVSEPSKQLGYFGERLEIPTLYQVVGEQGVDWVRGNTRTISADKFLLAMP